MIAGTGIDLVAVDALSAAAQRRVFTAAEHEDARRAARVEVALAGKFAVKEAFMKAVGAGLRQGVWFTQIEVLSEPSGAPSVRLAGEASRRLAALGDVRVHASLTHTRGWAAAVVVLEQPT